MVIYENIAAVTEYPLYMLCAMYDVKAKYIKYINIVLGLITVIYLSQFSSLFYFFIAGALYFLLKTNLNNLDVLMVLFCMVFFCFNFTSESCCPGASVLQILFYRGFSLAVDVIESQKDLDNSFKLPKPEDYIAYIFSPLGFWNCYFISYRNFQLIMKKPSTPKFLNIWFGIVVIYFVFYNLSTYFIHLKNITPKSLRGPVYIITSFFVVIKKIVQWKLTQFVVASSSILHDQYVNKDDLENAPITKLLDTMGVDEWYSNFGYTLSVFWKKYVKIPLNITNPLILYVIIAVSGCRNFRGLLFIPEIYLMMKVEASESVKALKKN